MDITSRFTARRVKAGVVGLSGWWAAAFCLLLLNGGPCARVVYGQTPPTGPWTGTVASLREDAGLEAAMKQAVAGYQGKVAVYAQNLATGQYIAMDADEPVQTASVIKLTILYYILEQIRAGKAAWSEPLTLTKADQVPGSGVLLFFDAPVQLTLHDVMYMMLILSDNTATNLLIDRFGIENIDRQIVALGLKNTWLYKRIMLPPTGPMPADQPKFGLGKTTAREMATVMTRLVTCDLGPYPGPGLGAPTGPICAKALTMLGDQFYRDSIPRYLDPRGLQIVNKTGALDHVRNDVGAVWTKSGPVVLSEFTWDNTDTGWTVDNTAELLMARLSREIVDRWQ